VVLLGLIAVAAAEGLGQPWLQKADAVAALGVALIVVWVSIRLGRKAVADLLDAVPRDLQEQVAAAAKVEGVLTVRKVRVRRSGPDVFADVTLTVSPNLGVERAHDVADAAEAAVRSELPRADVIIHTEPGAGQPEDLSILVRRLAERQGLAAHGLRVYEDKGRRSIDLHLEVGGELDVEKAHEKASTFEDDLRRALPDVEQIDTHIEPSGEEEARRPSAPVNEQVVLDALKELSRDEGLECLAHDVRVRLVEGELAVSFHCAIDPGTNIAEAHALTERVEQALRKRLPQLGRVVIHVEPEEGRGAGSE
jgi:divalent metal cation (Fe/Co/Zn/Cd) transporter